MFRTKVKYKCPTDICQQPYKIQLTFGQSPYSTIAASSELLKEIPIKKNKIKKESWSSVFVDIADVSFGCIC